MHFQDFDLQGFWAPLGAHEHHQPEPPSEAEIRSLEDELQLRLPASYIELMQSQNGGVPSNTCFPTNESTRWAHDHIAIVGIFAIGRDARLSLEQWGDSEFGICICDCPSGGHDRIMLDYRSNGPKGEPEVVHVDPEADETTWLAKDFECFIRGLVHKDVFEDSESDLALDLKRIAEGAFSPLLAQVLDSHSETNLAPILRKLCAELTERKGYFALHADPASHLAYGLQFLLLSRHQDIDKQAFLALYPKLIALGSCDFSTGGYAPDFVEDWLSAQLAARRIVAGNTGSLRCSPAYRESLLSKSKKYL